MSINERLEKVIKELYKGNKRAFSSTVGVSPTVIENVVGKRKGKPSYDVIEKICAYANVSPAWLLTGEGEMLNIKSKSSDSISISGSQNYVRQNSNVVNSSQVNEPMEHYRVDSNENLKTEVEFLNREIEYLKKEIEYLKAALEEKERVIQVVLKNKID